MDIRKRDGTYWGGITSNNSNPVFVEIPVLYLYELQHFCFIMACRHMRLNFNGYE